VCAGVIEGPHRAAGSWGGGRRQRDGVGSPAAADQGRRRRPRIVEVVREVGGGSGISGRASTISSSLSPRGEPRWHTDDASEAGAWAVGHECCVEAGSEGGGGRHGGGGEGVGWPAAAERELGGVEKAGDFGFSGKRWLPAKRFFGTSLIASQSKQIACINYHSLNLGTSASQI
jgi:hypothetical protein